MIQVYTANIGAHDPPRTDDTLCFTKDLWHDLILSARGYKTHPEIHCPDAEWTIWIDANVTLNVEPEELVEMCGSQDFGVFSHFHRDTVAQEAAAVIDGKYDSIDNVLSALEEYQIAALPLSGLAMTMVLVRKQCRENTRRNLHWWRDICRSSTRDQLTFPLHFPPPYWPAVDFTKPNKYFTRKA